MDLKVIRNRFTANSTEGELLVNGKHECYTLEDKDRGLTNVMPVTEINREKVFGQTAIPYGKYEVVLSYSNHFGKMLPLILNVPGFDGIRIHAGNKPADTEGCLLLGTIEGTDFIFHSVDAFNAFMNKFTEAIKTEKVFIEYTIAGQVTDNSIFQQSHL